MHNDDTVLGRAHNDAVERVELSVSRLQAFVECDKLNRQVDFDYEAAQALRQGMSEAAIDELTDRIADGTTSESEDAASLRPRLALTDQVLEVIKSQATYALHT